MYADMLLPIVSHKVEESDTASAFRILAKKTKSFGIKLVRSNSSIYKYGWNGETIRLIKTEREFKLRRETYDLCHELAHWLCSAPSRRVLIEFGLGTGFSTHDSKQADNSMVVSAKVALSEEVATCYLAALIQYELGIDVNEESRDTNLIYYDLNDDETPIWYDIHKDLSKKAAKEIRNSIDRQIKLMIEWGVIDKDLKLTWMPRQSEKDFVK